MRATRLMQVFVTSTSSQSKKQGSANAVPHFTPQSHLLSRSVRIYASLIGCGTVAGSSHSALKHHGCRSYGKGIAAFSQLVHIGRWMRLPAMLGD